MSDPRGLLLFLGAAVLAFCVGRYGRKLFDYLRGERAAKKPSGPPPSRQVRRAAERQRAKKDRE